MTLALLAALAACRVYGGDDSPAPLSTTGWVYVCFSGSEARELCYGASADALEDALGDGWACRSTQRHIGGCLYRCPPVKGCNAFDSCYCGGEP